METQPKVNLLQAACISMCRDIYLTEISLNVTTAMYKFIATNCCSMIYGIPWVQSRKIIAICASHLLNRAQNLLLREYNLLKCTKYLVRNLLTRFTNRLLHCAHNLRKLLRSSCSIARKNVSELEDNLQGFASFALIKKFLRKVDNLNWNFYEECCFRFKLSK